MTNKEKSTSRVSLIIWIGVGLLVLSGLFVTSYPKDAYERVSEQSYKSCSCFGSTFWFGAQCIGFVHNCSVVKTVVEHEVCEELTCNDVYVVLSKASQDNGLNESNGIFMKKESEIFLIFDASSSMLGSRFENAKRAAIRLVEGMEENEHLGIIMFSNTASVVRNFSSDKEHLIDGVNNISLSGGTRYLPALLLAQEGFAQGNPDARKGIIFMSDGVPQDESDEILEKVEQLSSQDIALFTISFGIDDEENSILEHMARLQQDVQAQSMYRSFEDTQDLSEAFYEAYKELTNERIMVVKPLFKDGIVIDDDDLERIGVSLFLNETRVSSVNKDDSLCLPDARVVALATSMNESIGSRVVNVTLTPNNDRYVFPVASLTPDTYDISVSAHLRISQEETCSFSGESHIGVLRVVETSCEAMSCEMTKEFLSHQQYALDSGVFFPQRRQSLDILFVVDNSESMAFSWRKAYRTVSSLNKLFSEDNRRGLVTFGHDSRLVQPYTHERALIDTKLFEVTLQGTTLMAPALRKAAALDPDIVFVVTDGLPYDDPQDVLHWASVLEEQGSCVVVVGFGGFGLSDSERRALLSRVSHCYRYAHEPSVDNLFAMVQSVLGSELSGEELDVDVRITPVSFPSKPVVELTVLSGHTGLLLPVSDSLACIAHPLVTAELFDDGKNKIADVELHLVGGEWVSELPMLLPGAYTLEVVAQVVASDCSFEFEKEVPFVVSGGRGVNEGVVFGGIIFFVVALFLIILHVRKMVSS